MEKTIVEKLIDVANSIDEDKDEPKDVWARLCDELGFKYINEAGFIFSDNIGLLLLKIVEEIKHQYIQRPRFCDGKFVQFGDEVEGVPEEVVGFVLYDDGSGCIIGNETLEECEVNFAEDDDPDQYNEIRHANVATDKNGVAYDTGDIVYSVVSGQSYHVVRQNGEGDLIVDNDVNGQRRSIFSSEISRESTTYDKDGVPIKVNDLCWFTKNIGKEELFGEEVRVTSVSHDCIKVFNLERGFAQIISAPITNPGHTLTHTEPSRDADGKPIYIGDVVYEVDNGNRHVIEQVKDTFCVTTEGRLPHPQTLTHKEPKELTIILNDIKQYIKEHRDSCDVKPLYNFYYRLITALEHDKNE